MTLIEKIENGSIALIDKKELDRLLRMSRQDIKKMICSAKECMAILDMSSKTFYQHIKTKDCLIRASKHSGKYVLKSVYEEAERLNR